MAQIVLAALPAALGAWIMAANVFSKEDSTSIVLPAQLQALLDGLFGLQSRRRLAQRRRLASHLAPLTLERDWLFGALPPSVTAAVLGRLDPLSRKALRAACRRTRLCVSGATPRLLLDGRGLRRFALAPLHVMFPQLREVHVAAPAAAPAAPAALPLRGGGAGGRGGCGPGQLLALVESGSLAALSSLELLDLSRWRRPACCFTRREWQALAAALATALQNGCGGGSSGGGAGSGVSAHSGGDVGRSLILRLDWRVLPLASVWPPPEQLPSWQEASWAARWMARKAPQVRLELEGPPMPLPGPATLLAFQPPGPAVSGVRPHHDSHNGRLPGAVGLRRLAVHVTAAPPWALRRFAALSSLGGLRQLTLRLPEDTGPGVALAPLQELPYLDQLALPATTLEDSDLQLLARLRALRSLLVSGLVLRGVNGNAGSANAVSGGAACRPGFERLVVSNRLEVDPHLGLLPCLPALSALGLRAEAIASPVRLLPRPRPAAAPAPPPPTAPAAAVEPVPPPLLQELLQHQLAQLAAGPAAAPPPLPPPPDVWAAVAPVNQHQAAGRPLAPPPLPPVCLRELCIMYGKRHSASAGAAAAAADRAPEEAAAAADPYNAAVGHGGPQQQHQQPPPLAAASGGTAAEELAADLAAQAAELPTLQRLRLWRCRSPAVVLGLLRPTVDRLQLPLVLLELHDVGALERREQRRSCRGASALAAAPGLRSEVFAAVPEPGDGGDNEEEDEDEASGSEMGEGDKEHQAPVAAAAGAREQGQEGSSNTTVGDGNGDAAAAELEQEEPAVLLTSLLTSRPWRSSSDELAALLLGCCRTLAVAGGHPSLLTSLAHVGRTAAAPRGASGGISGGGGVATQRLLVRRQPYLDEPLLRRLIAGLPGLQVLGVAGCTGVGVTEATGARRAAAATAGGATRPPISIAWTSEVLT